MTELTASQTSLPLGALLAARAVEGTVKVEVKWGEENSLSMQGDVVANTSAGMARSGLTTDLAWLSISKLMSFLIVLFEHSILRCLARAAKSLYGSTVLQQTEVQHLLFMLS